MHLQHLRYLQLVVEKGSFASAAEAAGVSQPAITLAMRGLEQAWGIVLFEKTGRQKTPTRAAVRAAQQAGELLGRIEHLPRTAIEPPDGSLGLRSSMLRVGMAPAAALLYARAVEAAWRLHAPDGLLQIVGGNASEMLTALQNDGLDLVIAPLPRRFSAAGIKRLTLHTSTPTIHARMGHPLAGARSLRDIAAAGWAVTGRAGTAGNVIEEAHRVHRLPPPRILVQCGNYPTLLELVSQTDLLCVVPHPVLRPSDAARGGFCVVKVDEGLPLYEVCLFWPATREPGHATLIASLVDRLQPPPAGCEPPPRGVGRPQACVRTSPRSARRRRRRCVPPRAARAGRAWS
jgi:DNA-binding transcriptional LysR family regulator